MEQGSRLDSTPVSARQDTSCDSTRDAARDAAITRMLTEPSVTARRNATPVTPKAADEISEAAARAREAAARIALDDAGLTSSVSAEIRSAIERHGVVVEKFKVTGDETNEECERYVNSLIEAEDGIAHRPSRTLADLRAKLTYFAPIMAPSMLDSYHVGYLNAFRDDADRLCGRPAAVQPDPVLAVIEKSRRLDGLHDALLVAVNDKPSDDPRWPEERAANDTLWRHWRETVLTTVPQTADGCRALAAYAAAWFKVQGSNDEDAETILGLIAHSPLSERAAAVDTTDGRVPRPKPELARDAEPEVDEADRTALLAQLLALYAEERASRPIEEDKHNTVAFRAAELVQRRTWKMAREVLALPPPRTHDGLALAALGCAILVEGDCRSLRDPTDCAVAGLTRAALAFTGLGEPPGYTGLGYEADHLARDRAVCSGAGSVPVWAVAEIEAEGEPDDEPDWDASGTEQAEQSEATPDVQAPDAGPAIHAAPYADISASVEARLLELASSYEGFARARDNALAFETKMGDVLGMPLPHNESCAFDKALHYAQAGMEEAVRHAMALPATTLRAFGLQAQILEHDAGSVWEDDDIDLMRCRALLQGLIAAAGSSPIEHHRVSTDEIRGWLADPATAPGAEPAWASAQ